VYVGYQWNSIVIQDVALKICHISKLHFEQKIVGKQPDYQPLHCYENILMFQDIVRNCTSQRVMESVDCTGGTTKSPERQEMFF